MLPEGPSGGLPIVRDLLFHLPSGLIDRRATYPLRAAPPGVTATFVVTVESHQPPSRGRRKSPYRVLCSNDTGDLTLVFFNAAEDYITQALPVGQQRVVSGQTEHFEYRLQMTHPEVIAPLSELARVQTIEPVYPLTAGLTNRRLATLIRLALEQAPDMPEWIGSGNKWQGWKASLLKAHAPQEAEDLLPMHPARARLAYDEILANQLYLALLRGRAQGRPGKIITPTEQLRGALKKQLPFTLTKGQEQAIMQIDADMQSGKRMVRLLQGDVGSGKTVVALLAALGMVENGLQCAIMAPTEVVARQHTQTLVRLCANLPVRIALLTGSVKGKAREALLADIENGGAQIIVGTHALFQEHVQFKSLGLIVIDEQHRFGVGQRMALSAKGEHPHLLHMTATPIPRSLAMTMYGDMDSTLLTEKPALRQPITTRVIPLSRMDQLMQAMQSALKRGEKIYWICPQIDDDSVVAREDVAAAEARHITFRAMFGAGVGMMHGRMKPDEREAAMQAFTQGSTRLLVATTVVEVGVDVSDATIIIIEQAERFGLSQLHQLRGRVGRGEKPSSCVLLYGRSAGEEAIQRLSVLRATDDGFLIAEEDLKLRGGGDLLGTRQTGVPQFRFTDLVLHAPLIAQAREEAAAIAKADPDLEKSSAHRILLGLYGYEYGY